MVGLSVGAPMLVRNLKTSERVVRDFKRILIENNNDESIDRNCRDGSDGHYVPVSAISFSSIDFDPSIE